MGRVFSTQKRQKKPLSSSTGMTPETLIYHNACNREIRDLMRVLFRCILFNEGIDFSFRLSFRKAYVGGGGGKGGTTASRTSRSRESSVSRFVGLSNDFK